MKRSHARVCQTQDDSQSLTEPMRSEANQALIATRRRVCKTFIRRFDSDPRLQPNSLNPSKLQAEAEVRQNGRIRTKAAKSGRILYGRQTLRQTFCQAYPYVYAWGPRGNLSGAMDRKGQACRIVAPPLGKKAGMNSALVEFLDGFLAVISRNALRRRRSA